MSVNQQKENPDAAERGAPPDRNARINRKGEDPRSEPEGQGRTEGRDTPPSTGDRDPDGPWMGGG